PAPQIEARQGSSSLAHMLVRQDRGRLTLQSWQLVHVVVKRLEATVPGIADDLIQATAFRFAGKERNTKLLGMAQFWRPFWKHRQAPRDMKSADTNRQTGSEKRPCQVD